MVGVVALGMVWTPTIVSGVNELRKSGKAAVYRPLDPDA